MSHSEPTVKVLSCCGSLISCQWLARPIYIWKAIMVSNPLGSQKFSLICLALPRRWEFCLWQQRKLQVCFDLIIFVVNGTNVHLFYFQFVSEEMHRGMPCLKYERKNRRYNKTNTYSFFISKTKPHRPLRYEMMGYDDMLTSHYDHYVLDYISFEPWKFNRSVFGLPKSKWCSEN